MTSTFEVLAQSAGEAATDDVLEIDTLAISVIQLYTLDSTHDLIQLAHVVTSPDCECAGKLQMREVGTFQDRGVDRHKSGSHIVLALDN
jgi:hypothetical protein